MASVVNLLIDPTVPPGSIQKIFDALVTEGKAKAVEVAKALSIEATAKLRLQVDGRELRVTAEEQIKLVDDLAKAYDKANKTQNGSKTNLQQVLNTTKSTRDQTQKLVESVNQYGKRVITINPVWEAQNRKVLELNRALQLAGASSFWDRVKVGLNVQGLQSFSRGISELVNGFQSVTIILQQVTALVNTLVNSLKGVEQIGLTFQAIGQGASGGNKALAEASRIALNLGVDLNTVREGFLKLSPVILQSGGSLDDVSKITQSLSSRFAAFGKTADEAKRVTNAVIQAFGKGALRSEELNQQIAEADQAFRVDFANALGVTSQAFGEMVENGEITNDVLLKTLPLLDKSSLVYGKLGTSALDAANALGTVGVTTQQIQSKIATINQLSLEKLSNSFKPLIKAILQVQAIFADLFATLAKSETIKALGAALGAIGGGFVELLKVLTQLIKILVTVLDPLAQFVTKLLEIEPIAKALGILIAVLLVGALVKAVIGAIAFSAALTKGALSALGFSGAVNTAALAVGNFNTATLGGKAIGGFTSLLSGAGGKVAQFGKFLLGSAPIFSKVGQSAKGLAGNISGLGANLAKGRQGVASAASNWKIYAKALQDSGGVASKAAAKLAPINANLAASGQQAITAGTKYATFTQRLGAARATLTSIGGPLKAITGGVARFGLQSAAIGSVIAAFDGFAKSQSGVNRVNEQTKTSVAAATQSYDQLKSTLGATATEQSKLAERSNDFVNFFQSFVNTLGSVIPGFKQLNLEQASFQGETQALIAGQEKFNLAMQKSIDLFREQAGATDRSKESTAKLAAGTKGIVAAYDENEAQLKSYLEALKRELPTTEASRESHETLIAVAQGEIVANKAKRLAILAVAAAAGVDVSGYDKRIAASAKYVEKLKEELAAIKEKNEAQIKDLEGERDTKTGEIDKNTKAITDKNDKEIAGIEKVKAAADKRYAAEDAAIERSRQLKDRQYNAEIEQLSKLAAAVAKVYDQQIGRLQGPTGAESQLAALDKRDLERQAAQGETQRERLQAKAQLERLEREKQIAALQAQKEAELARIEEERAKKEEQRKQEQLQREEADYQRKIKRELEKEALEDKIEKRREANRLAEEQAEADKKKVTDEYAAKILPLQDEITKKTKELKTQEDALAAARSEYNTRLANSLPILQQILDKETAITKTVNSRKSGGGSGTTGGTPRNTRGGGQLQQAWAGGPVAGGTSYIVNELGQESFLSSTGRLSYIDAPAWGKWKAPGAGTVIPAHITAGLAIPTGGTRVNSGAAAAARTSSTGRDNSLAKILGAALGAPQGRVTNNVTIQSANTTKAASDILVELTKIKRNRYR
jgi:tape measure domain-containing protein